MIKFKSDKTGDGDMLRQFQLINLLVVSYILCYIKHNLRHLAPKQQTFLDIRLFSLSSTPKYAHNTRKT